MATGGGGCLGRRGEDLWRGGFGRRHLGARRGFLVKPQGGHLGTGLVLYGLRKDGTEFPVDISLAPLETEEGILVTSAIRDITERKQLEMDLRLTQDKLRTLAHTLIANEEEI